jgi:hypothetical protein
MADRLDDRMVDRMDGRMADRRGDQMADRRGDQMVDLNEYWTVGRGRADHLDDHLRRSRAGHAEGRQRPRLVDLLSDRVDPFQEGLLEGHRNRV